MKAKIILTILVFAALASNTFAQVPNIQSFAPKSGTVREVVEITGNNFGTTASAIKVFFGAAEAEVKNVTENQIKVLVPSGATYDNIMVVNTTTGLSAVSPDRFLISFGGEGINASQFDPQKDYSTEINLYDHCLGDFNLDGKVDVATAHYGSNNICIFRNTSTILNVNFDNKKLINIGTTGFIRSGDLDGDGKLDLVASKWGPGDKVVVLRNLSTKGGDIVFDSAPLELSVIGNSAKEIVLRDLDSDGKPEIVISNEANNNISILKNLSSKGSITFDTTPLVVAIDQVDKLYGLTLGDLNGDRLPEIITAPQFSGNSIYVKLNVSAKGSISFDDSTRIIPIASGIISVAVGDLNNDSKPDIAVTRLRDAKGEGKVTIMVNKTEGTGGEITFDPKPAEFPVVKEPWGLDIGDLDGDGKADIAVASVDDEKKLGILRNISTDADPKFDRVYSLNTNEPTRSIKVGDINGDGRPDLSFTSISSPKISIIKNRHNLLARVYPKTAASICGGKPIRLRAPIGLGVKYKWYWGTVELPDTDFFIEVQPLKIGEYKVFISDLYNNHSEMSASTLVSLGGTIPVKAEATNSGPVCEGGTVSLKATAMSGVSYFWAGPGDWKSTDQNPVLTSVTPSMTGSYILTTKSGDCFSEPDTTVVVLLPSNPVANIVASKAIICDGGDSELNAGDVPGNIYKWTKNGTAIAGPNSYSLKVTEPGTYAVEITSASGCSTKSKAVNISKLTPPKASFSSPDYVCKDVEIKFASTTTGLNPDVKTSYSWNLGGYVPKNSTDSVKHTFTRIGTYTVKMKVIYGGYCVSEYEKKITVGNKIDIKITPDRMDKVCDGDPVVLTADPGFSSYKWNTGAETQSITVNVAGTFSVNVQNSSGCTGSGSYELKFLEKPTLTVTADNLNPINVGDSVQLTASGAETYTWSPTTGLSNPNIPNPKVSPKTTTIYTVTATSTNTCSVTDSVEVKLNPGYHIFPTNVFTPNGDTKNEKWAIGNIENYQNCKVMIFNRQGQKVYEALPYYNHEWDGKMNGKDVPEGAYYFVIQCNENEKAKAGSLTLVR